MANNVKKSKGNAHNNNRGGGGGSKRGRAGPEEQDEGTHSATDGVTMRLGLGSVRLDARETLLGVDRPLEERLEAQAAYFDVKLALVPPKAYKAAAVDEDAWMKVKARSRPESAKTKAGKKEKLQQQQQGKKNAPSKQVLRKFDPMARRTLPEMIDAGSLAAQDDEGDEVDVASLFQPAPPHPEDNGDEQVDPAAAAAADATTPAQEVHSAPHKFVLPESLGFVPGTRAKTPAELKQRMAAVREWYKTQRPGKAVYPEDEEGVTVPGNMAVEGEPPKSKKRAKKEREALEKKEKQKLRKKMKKQKKKEAAASTEAQDASAAGVSAPVEEAPAPSISDQVSFGRFNFSTGKPLPMHLEGKKRKSSDVELLKKAEMERAKEREIVMTGDGVEELEERQWDKMLTKATGGKVRDDPAMLKKIVKKKEKQKSKSRTAWADKTKKLEEQKVHKQADYLERQKKNLARKKLGAKGSAKAPRDNRRAGFEGRKKKLN